MHKAFVSSTYADLKGHRARVIGSLRNMGFFVDPMEDWTAESDEPKVFSTERIRGCEVFVLLVAFRRGFVPAGESESITQLEYEFARRERIDVLAFLAADDAPWRRDLDDTATDPELGVWRDLLQQRHGVGYFGWDPESLDVAPALGRWLTKRQQAGPAGTTETTKAPETGSALAGELRLYFEALVERPDRPPLPAYLGARVPTSLYVPHELILRGDEDVPSATGARDAVVRPVVPADALDIGEVAAYGERLEAREWRVSWNVERTKLQSGPGKAAVLAPAGGGKSLLAKMSVWDLSRDSLAKLDLEGRNLDALPLPVLLTLDSVAEAFTAMTERGRGPDDASPQMTARNAIAQALVIDGCSQTVADYVAAHAHETRTWLFLDAVDEVAESHALIPLLRTIEPWDSRLVLTSRLSGYDASLLPFRVSEYRVAPFSWGQVQSFVQNWFDGVDVAGRIERLLARSPSLQQMAQSPFLLTLICWVLERHPVPEQATRTELYDRVVRDMLSLSPGGGRISELRASEWLPLISELAFGLLSSRLHGGVVPAERLLELLAESELRPALDGLDAATTARLTHVQQASGLVTELTRRRFLVPADASGSRFTFPHRSIWEFLAARPLAERLASPTTGDAWTELEARAWDPRWEQVIVFVAGLLGAQRAGDGESHVDPLLAMLTDRRRDDLLRHRLGLAALCVAELSPSVRASHRQALDRVGEEVLREWEGHEAAGTGSLVPHLRRALPALASAECRVEGMPIGEWVLGRLEHGDARDRERASTLAVIVAAAISPDLAPRFGELLGHPESGIRRTAAQALGGMVDAAAGPTILGPLTSLLLEDDEESVRSAAARSIERLGSAATSVTDRLAALLQHDDPTRRKEGALAARAVGRAAATPTILERLTDLLVDRDPVLRRAGARTLGSFGAVASTHEVLDRLAGALTDPSPEVRRGAAWAAGAMGSPASTPEIVERIAVVFDDVDAEVRAWAAWAAGRLTATTGPIMEGLGTLLSDEDAEVRRVAAETLGELGTTSARLFTSLTRALLEDGEWRVRRAAARALASPKVRRSQPGFLEDLTARLRSPSAEIRQGAMWCIEATRRSAGIPAIIERLGEILNSGEPGARADAALAIAAIGSPAANASLIARLDRLLQEGAADERQAAARALGSLESASATARLLATVTHWFEEGDADKTRAALECLTRAAVPVEEPSLLERLAGLSRDGDEPTRRLAAEALARATRAGMRGVGAAGSDRRWVDVRTLSEPR